MTNIAIIGCGWVGKPLAHSLIRQGYNVTVSTRSRSSLDKAISSGLAGFICDLSHHCAIDELTTQLRKNRVHVVIGAFPPGFRKGLGGEYATYWSKLVTAAKQAKVTKIIMISSTTVYPSRNATLSETDASLTLAQGNPEFTENAVTMLKAEQKVIDSGLEYVIVRFSGLFGPDRHPARFVNKLKQISSSAPANMLHLDDAIGVNCFAIKELSDQIINATSPDTVSKAEFYRAAVGTYHEALSLPPLADIPDKRISAEKIRSLGYVFRYPNATDGLKKC
ncbi:NAD(P)H-binding protein [Vibrio sp. JC009]|uniref:NAD(P)H-binding protein n=1 Tax=Vibrio sp. JC009 TaxID=2912314 RepID=UPI0023AFBB11|nr:NAD(P)H-binding protein [Vibrio sp. JC009]WED20747.1 NAD(P)H-binding protein [Vibrio sp. JC009]